MTTLADGVQFVEVEPAPGEAKFWIYLPAGAHAAASLPCVFVPPAGSNLITGMKLGDGDRTEHLPYVKAGFAVVSFELDGAVAEQRMDQMIVGIRRFMGAHGGVDNAKKAVDYTLAKCPEVDPKRLFIAGHSSAATLALDVIAADERIKACAAYAAIPDVRERVGDDTVKMLNGFVKTFDGFVDTISPAKQIDKLKGKPILLFSADDDDNAKPEAVKKFAADLQQAGGTQIKLKTVPQGGHYESMIKDGIPAGIEFFKSFSPKPAGWWGM